MKREGSVWLVGLLAIGLGIGCGSRDSAESETDSTRQLEAPASATVVPVPEAAAPRDIAILEIADHGEIRLELLPGLAPKSVESFVSLAEADFYDGTLFHRVIPGFMIQGGDPNSKDDDPSNDGMGGPGYTLPDEFSQVSFVRGIVALAHTARPNSAGSQFFIVHEDSRHLDGQYSVIGQVTAGIDVVDAISRVPTGTGNRPQTNVVLVDARIEKSGSASAAPEEATEPEAPSRGGREWDEGSS